MSNVSLIQLKKPFVKCQLFLTPTQIRQMISANAQVIAMKKQILEYADNASFLFKLKNSMKTGLLF